MRKTVFKNLKAVFPRIVDNYNSPSSESCMVEKLKDNAKDKTFSQSRETTIQDKEDYRNETQAIDSEKQFIENKVMKVQAIKSIR